MIVQLFVHVHYDILLRFCIQSCFVFYLSTLLKIKRFNANIITSIYYSDQKISSQHDASHSVQEKRFAYLENSNITLSQMFLILCDVFQELLSFTDADEKFSPNDQASMIRHPLIDINNNDLPMITIRDIKQCDFSARTTKDLGNNNCDLISFYEHECANFAKMRLYLQ